MADTVRGLCSGKGFLFADRGEFVEKGIEEGKDLRGQLAQRHMSEEDDQQAQQGYLLLADISGYAAFLTGTELEHSHAIVC